MGTKRILAAVALTAATAVLAVTTTSARAAAHAKLIGVVGKNDAYKITLKTPQGKLVKTLKAGTYVVVVHDDSAIHNYELDGPHGKSWTFTAVPFMGTKTFTLKLVAGAYKAYCSAHESLMFQHFRVR
jgi:plastocyanin